MELHFLFKSPDHIRFESGQHVSGPHNGANRIIKVEPDKYQEKSFTVTIYNPDGKHPVWNNNIQMSPKQMRVIEEYPDKIVLRGWGTDSLGEPFDDYGLTINLKNNQVFNCILHLFDRKVDIKYLNESELNEPITDYTETKAMNFPEIETQLVVLSQRAASKVKNGDFGDAIIDFLEYFRLRQKSNNLEGFEEVDKSCYFYLCYSYVNNNDYDEALMLLNKFIELYPNNFDAHKLKVETLFELGKFSDAIDDINIALQIKPERDDLLMNKGIAYLNLGDRVKAKNAFLEAKGLGNKDADDFIKRYCS